jgi:hypothetical protein
MTVRETSKPGTRPDLDAYRRTIRKTIREESWGILSYGIFLLVKLRRMGKIYPSGLPSDYRKEVR